MMSATSIPDHTRGRYKLDRVGGFSDGVIAIAITILVLGLEVPSVHVVNEKHVMDFLRDSTQPAIGYIISFLLIAMYWSEHYTSFHYMTHATPPLLGLNSLFLLCISFLPFPTGLHSAYPDHVSVMLLYGIAQFLYGLSLLAVWWYAEQGHRLIDPQTPPAAVRSVTRRLMIAPTLSVVAIICAFFSIPLSKWIFATIPVIYVLYLVAHALWRDK